MEMGFTNETSWQNPRADVSVAEEHSFEFEEEESEGWEGDEGEDLD